MTQAGADWQVYQYGHTQHAFTNPEAHEQAMGTIYNAQTEKRALQSMKNFLQELMNKE
jgi:dienelactone hydrolase